ncbi:hypothetical protein BJY00DRAFT_317888 [Aspergillus carlsbadensis]|nr:hypothetical protein BJY00DRAFT_317888 [Aspergillus carlsbadensis]
MAPNMPQIAQGVMDPDGDLIISRSGVSILISSKALCLASPVFHAMFISGFREGRELRDPSPASSRASIQLPGDNPDAFRVFSWYAHHKATAMPHAMPFDDLVHFAILVDKYNYSGSCYRLRMFGEEHSLHAKLTRPRAEVHGADSQLGGRQQYFTSVIRLYPSVPPLIQRLLYSPNVFVGQLDRMQRAAARKTETALTAPIQNFTHLECNQFKQAILEYTRQLDEGGILPGSAEYHNESISQVHEAAQGQAKSWEASRWVYRSYQIDCACHDCKQHEKLVNAGAVRLKRTVEGVKFCLPCLRAGACSKHQSPVEQLIWREYDFRFLV